MCECSIQKDFQASQPAKEIILTGAEIVDIDYCKTNIMGLIYGYASNAAFCSVGFHGQKISFRCNRTAKVLLDLYFSDLGS